MRRGNRSTWGKTSHGRVENHKLNQYMTPSAEIEPGPHWWNTKIWFIKFYQRIRSQWSESIRSDEGLTLETSALQSLYSGQFTLSTPLINQIFVYYSPTDAAPQFLQKLIPFTHWWKATFTNDGKQGKRKSQETKIRFHGILHRDIPKFLSI